ncbi:hypothetical protein Tco_0818065 [Tanacetum coccineum]
MVLQKKGKRSSARADLEGPAFNLVKAFHKNSVFLQYQMDECHKCLDKIRSGKNYTNHISFFNKDLDYLLTGDKERKIALSISKLKAARYLDFGLEELVPSLWVESERNMTSVRAYGITQWLVLGEGNYINNTCLDVDKSTGINRTSWLKTFIWWLEYNKGMETGSGQRMTREKAKVFITGHREMLQIRMIYRSLESFVGGRIRDIDYRLINRTT